MDTQDRNDNIITAEPKLGSDHAFEMDQIVLLKKQLRFTQITCVLLAALIVTLLIIALIVIPQLMETLEQTSEALAKLNGDDGSIAKLTDAIDKLNNLLNVLPFGS